MQLIKSPESIEIETTLTTANLIVQLPEEEHHANGNPIETHPNQSNPIQTKPHSTIAELSVRPFVRPLNIYKFITRL